MQKGNKTHFAWGVVGHYDKMEEVRERLKKYTSRKHDDLLIAVEDNLLSTQDLIELGKEIIMAERDNNEESRDYLPLMILHLRSTEDTLNKSLVLLKSNSSVDRELGCRILREFPRLDEHPTKFSERIINSMDNLIETEKDESVILSALSTIGWQGHDKGHEILLRMSTDPRNNIRYVVADNLLMVFGDGRKVTEETAKIFLKLAKDSDEDIRRSVFYDIAEFPDIFSSFIEEFKEAAEYAKNDSFLEVRNDAARAFDGLEKTTYNTM